MVVTLKSSTLIKPAKPTPSAAMCLAECDQDKPITHTPTVYIYRRPSSPSSLFSFALAAETLKNSLGQLLVHFYPLAGRLHMTDGGRVALDCNSAGAMFYEAESDAKIQDFKDFAPTRELRALVPSVDDISSCLHEQPLVLAQLTQLSCGGITLGLAISHTMIDGVSHSYFVSEWATLARGETLQNAPFLDRSILRGSSEKQQAADGHRSTNKYTRFVKLPLLMGKTDDQEERSNETTVTMLHVSRAQVRKIRVLANENRAANLRPYSTFEAVAGHMWRCASEARGHHPDQPTKLGLPVNFRQLMQLPRWYCGNANFRTYASSTSGELIAKPLGYASSRIREAIEMVTPEAVKSTLDEIARMSDLNRNRTFHKVGTPVGLFVGNPNLDINSWLSIPMQGVDFGWGKEIYMGPGSLNLDGKSIMLAGRNEVGSLCITLRLQVSHMDNFLKFFYQDISTSLVHSYL